MEYERRKKGAWTRASKKVKVKRQKFRQRAFPVVSFYFFLLLLTFYFPSAFCRDCYTGLVLIDTYAPTSDASESHQIKINAATDSVYRHLWSADLAGSIMIKILMGLRTLPGLLLLE